jgi:filamentous hemagglutinin
MNRIYRIVRSKKTGFWLVACETARSCGTGAAAAVLSVALSGMAWAQTAVPSVVLSAGQAATAYVGANGRTTVVNINAPSSGGLSHNTFTTYNVSPDGLVLNNVNPNIGITAQTTLAGQVLTNPNLLTSASTILNEVVSANRSVLNGFTEVAGQRAAVVVANPNGISCAGCGFINTGWATLTTGIPTVTAGQLTGITVTQGDILIEGTGLNAKGVNASGNDSVSLLNLLTRSIKIDGPLNAKELDIRAGAQTYTINPTTLAVTGSSAATGVGVAPALAIDATALGGMYADTIRLVATEVGVGVRMRNDVATNLGDFVLTAAGKIELRGKISAAQDVALSTSASDASASEITDAALNLWNSALTAARDLSASAEGQMWIEGGQLYAGRNASLQPGSLKDRTSVSPQQGNNQRYAVQDFTAQVTGMADVAATNWQAGRDLTIAAGSISATEANTQLGAGRDLALISTARSIALGQAQVQAVNELRIDAASRLLVGNGGGQGVESTEGNLSLKVGGLFTNTGSIRAKNQSSVDVGSMDNSGAIVLSTERTPTQNDIVTVRGNALNQSAGQLMSNGSMVFSLSSDLTNRGLLQSTGGIELVARNFIQDTTDAKTMTGTSNVGATDLASSITLSEDLSNKGLVQAGHDLTVNARALKQTETSSALLGAMSGNGAMIVTLGAPYTDGLWSSTGNIATVFSGRDLSISAPSMTNDSNGLWGARRDLRLTATTGNITNFGAIYAGNDLAATAANGQIQNFIKYRLQQDQLLGIYNGVPYRDGPGNPPAFLFSFRQVLDTKATMNAGRDVSLVADSVVNSSEVNAGRDIMVTAREILNQVQGGDTRVWSGADMGSSLDSMLSSAQGLNYFLLTNDTSYYSFPDQYERLEWIETWKRTQYFGGGTPVFKPLMKAVGTISLQDFAVAKNLGGVTEGNNLVISTDRAGATFINDALTLTEEAYTRRSTRSVDFIAKGPLERSRTETPPITSKLASAVNFWPDGANLSDNVGASVRAVGTVTITGVSLLNLGPVLTGNASASVAPGEASVKATAASAFPGLILTLPSSPNGYFVTSRDPASRYLVESNPLFNAGGSTLGSDYLMSQLGISPELTQRRLGDASYEAYLVQQQLVEQTGSALLDGRVNVAEVYQNLMENAAVQAGTLGLEYGQAPTAEQLANLTENIVWMVEVEVDGQKVLAPVVYLAPATVASIDRGATIVASALTLDVTDMMNAGGTLGGSERVDITSRGDITNLSGTIRGGDLSLASTEGSIRNETFAQTTGDTGNMQTTIGRTAGIQASGNLSLDAANNIENRGAQMSAGGNASLNAGDNITFDTIEDKTSRSTTRVISEGMASGNETTTTTTVTQIKSGLTVGGNLEAQAKNDITLAGTDANVAGDARLNAGNNLNIIARENTVTTDTQSNLQGLGVGGGIYGMTETTTNAFSSRNVGSSLNIGGNADLSAGQTMTVQGSKVNVGGDTTIEATDVRVLAGKDVDRTTTTTKTTSFLQIENVGDGQQASSYANSGSQGDSSAQAGTQAEAGGGEASASASASGSASTGASAGAGASYADSAGVTLMKSTTTTESTLSQRSVGSELNLGGNVRINARNNVTLQGSELNAGGNVDLNAKNVELLAAQNIEQRSYSSTTTRLGLYATTENTAGAGAQAGAQSSAQAQAGASGSMSEQSVNASASAEGSAGAQAGAQAGASSNNTVDVLRVDTKQSESLKVTNTGSAIRSGGNMSLNVQESLRTVGSTLEAQGDVDLKAKNMSFEAAQDIEYSKESTSTLRAGLYLDAGAGAEAKAEAGANANAGASAGSSGMGASAEANANAGASAEAGANAEAKIGIGIQVKDTRSTTESASSTAVTSAIISRGGSITRTAQGTIRDVGTNIEAASDFSQTADRIESLAAENSQFTRTTNESTTVRLGVYAAAGAGAEAQAGASAEAGANAQTGGASAEAKAEAGASAEAGAEAVVGIEVSVERKLDTTATRSTQAVTSNIRAGGNINSQSRQATVLQGTNIEAGGEVNLGAAELQVLAARNTEETTTSSETVTASLTTKAGVGAQAEASAQVSTEDGGSANAEAGAGVRVGVETEMGLSQSSTRDASTTAVAANISGGRININTTGRTTLEGTNLNAGDGGVNIAADSLDFKAAKDTFESSSQSSAVDVSLNIQATVLAGANIDAKVNVSTEVASESSSGSNAVVGSINSGGGLNITTRGNTRLEGTQISVGGDTNVAAGGDVRIEAARNSFQAESQSVNVSAGFDKDQMSANLNLGVNKSSESGSEAVVSNINTGGSLNISAGRNMTIEGANIEAGRDAQLAAGGNVTFNEARNEYRSDSIGVDVGLGTKTEESENQLASKQTKSESSQVEGSLGLGVDNARSSEAVTGSIKAGSNLTVAAGGNATFVGTELAAGNSAQIAASGDINFKAAESSSSGITLGLESRASAAREDRRRLSDEDNKGDVETTKTEEAEGSVSFGVNSSTQRQGSNISAGAGGIQVSSGGNVNLQGTQMQTDGAADISAAGKVTQTAAVSSSAGFGVSVSGSATKEETTGSVPDAADDKKEADKADDQSGAEEAGGPQTERGANLGSLTLTASVDASRTSINAAGGSTARSGVVPSGPIPGVSMTLRGTIQTDGSLQALVPVPGNLPAGSAVKATQPDGSPLPDWVKFDPATGSISGTPPADFSGSVSLVVGVPQADGSVRRIGVQF